MTEFAGSSTLSPCWIIDSRTKTAPVLPESSETSPSSPFPQTRCCLGQRAVGCAEPRTHSRRCLASSSVWLCLSLNRVSVVFGNVEKVLRKLKLGLQLWERDLLETWKKNVVKIGIFKDEAVSEEVISKICKGWEKNRWSCLWILLLNVAWKNNKQLWGQQWCRGALSAYNGRDLAWTLKGWKEQPCGLVLMAITPPDFEDGINMLSSSEDSFDNLWRNTAA